MMTYRYGAMVALAGFLLVISYASAQACTTFVIGERDSQLFGRNYDFDFGDGYIIVNKRGVSKTAFKSRLQGEGGQPVSWISRFGSVTFNQYGREFPQGGMNETGLVVEAMALMSTRFPPPDSRPYLPNSLLWRQYLLDTCSSVNEVIESDSKVRISYDASKGIGIHLLVLDREGNAAIIEFLEGKTVVHTGDSLPIRALTNNTYQESLTYWKNRTSPFFDSAGSIRRFVTVAGVVHPGRSVQSKPNVEEVFTLLDSVKWEKTRWGIVYDNRNSKIHLKTDGNAAIRIVDVARFDFSCRTSVKSLNINHDLIGDVTQNFQEYEPAINLDSVKTSFGKLDTRIQVPEQVVEFLGNYPQQCECRE